MAPRERATLRIPVELKNEIGRLAEARGTTMVDVVSHAVDRLTRESWWSSVHDALGEVTEAEVTAYRAATDELDAAAALRLHAD